MTRNSPTAIALVVAQILSSNYDRCEKGTLGVIGYHHVLGSGQKIVGADISKYDDDWATSFALNSQNFDKTEPLLFVKNSLNNHSEDSILHPDPNVSSNQLYTVPIFDLIKFFSWSDDLVSDATQLRYQSLKNQLDLELIKYKSLITVEDVVLNTTFNNIASQLSRLKFSNSDVEILENGLKLSFVFNDDTFLTVTKPLENVEDLNEDDIIYSVFVDDHRVTSNVLDIELFVSGFEKFLIS